MKILISGFFGEGNLGDEAILNILQSYFNEDFVLFVTSKKPQHRASKAIGRKGLMAWQHYLRAASISKHAIFTGGILQDWSIDGLLFFALRILAANIMGCQISFWGAGLGPLRKKSSIAVAKRVLQKVDVAWLRDSYSKHLFEKISAKKANYGTDWTWKLSEQNILNNSKSDLLALNLREWKFANYSKQIQRIINLTDKKVIGIAARASDAKEVSKNFTSVSSVLFDSFDELLKKISICSFALTMRYHVSLAAIMSGIPLILIPYDDKVANLAKEAGINTLLDTCFKFKPPDNNYVQREKKRFSQMEESFKCFFLSI